MKKKISLKKLELKINKVSDLKTTNITGGKKATTNCTGFTNCICPPPTDNYQGADTSVAICWC